MRPERVTRSCPINRPLAEQWSRHTSWHTSLKWFLYIFQTVNISSVKSCSPLCLSGQIWAKNNSSPSDVVMPCLTVSFEMLKKHNVTKTLKRRSYKTVNLNLVHDLFPLCFVITHYQVKESLCVCAGVSAAGLLVRKRSVEFKVSWIFGVSQFLNKPPLNVAYIFADANMSVTSATEVETPELHSLCFFSWWLD